MMKAVAVSATALRVQRVHTGELVRIRVVDVTEMVVLSVAHVQVVRASGQLVRKVLLCLRVQMNRRVLVEVLLNGRRDRLRVMVELAQCRVRVVGVTMCMLAVVVGEGRMDVARPERRLARRPAHRGAGLI